MATHTKLINITTGKSYRLTRILRGIEECSWCWYEEGVSVRSLTPAEAISMRNKQAADREPLAYAEIPGLVYTGKTDYTLIREAHKFASEASWPPPEAVNAVIASLECA